MMKVDAKGLFALLLCAGATFVVHAADESTAQRTGWQFGGGAGQSTLNLSVTGTPGSIDLHKLGYQVFGGYRFGRYAAAEVSYLNGGTVSLDGGGATVEINPRMFTATGMGILPLNEDFALFARAGLAHWFYDLNVTEPGVGTGTVSETANEPIFGVGASLFMDRALVRLEFEQTQTSVNGGSAGNLDERLRLISLSVVWMF
jgi:OOP family OmpA-OmpF porin